MTTILTMLLREIGLDKSENHRGGISLPWHEKGESSKGLSAIWDIPLCDDVSMEASRGRFSDPRAGR